jgi:hypothetical protein
VRVVSSLQVFQSKFCTHFTSLSACYITRPPHPPWLDHPNIFGESCKLHRILWSLRVMKLLTMQCSPASHHFFLLRYKYSPERLVLKHPQSMFFSLVWVTKFYTHTKLSTLRNKLLLKRRAFSLSSKLEGHPFSAVLDCLFNIFAATLRNEAVSTLIHFICILTRLLIL